MIRSVKKDFNGSVSNSRIQVIINIGIMVDINVYVLNITINIILIKRCQKIPCETK